MRGAAETLTIVFTDLVDSTAIRTRLGEDEADRLATVHHDLLAAIVERFRGRVIKGTGDGVLAVFDSAVDALDAAVEVQRACDRYSRAAAAVAPMHVRVGVSTGDVTWDANDDIAGAAAVEAKRLEAAATPGQVLVSDLTRLICRGRGDHVFTDVGDLELKGFDERVHAWALTWDRSPRAASVPLAAHLARGVDNFVGRTVERDRLRTLLEPTTDRRPQFVNVLGEPGIGKTTLVAVACQEAHANGRTVLFGRCDRELSVPYRPFAEVIDAWARALGSDSIDSSHLLLGHFSASVRDALGEPPSGRGNPMSEQLALFEAVRSWCAEVEPVIVIDDLQWATEPTVLLLRHLTGEEASDDTLIIATTRTTERPAHVETFLADAMSRGRSDTISLRGLADEEIVELFGGAEVSDLAARTGGNPLFLLALGIDSRDAASATVEAAVARRVQGTDDRVQDVLRMAAIVGLDFDARVLADGMQVDEDEVLDHLEAAVDAGLIQEQSVNRFSFSHGLVQEVLVDDISRSRRARLHARVAEALERRDPGAYTELARHYDAAGQPEKAIPHLERMADDADRSGDLAGSIRLHRRLADLHTDDTGSIRHELGVIFARLAGGESTDEFVGLVHDLLRRAKAQDLSYLYLRSTWALVCLSIGSGQDKGIGEVVQDIDPSAFPDADQRVLATSIVAFASFLAEDVGLSTAMLESVEDLVDEASSTSALLYYDILIHSAQRPIDLPRRLEASRRMRELQEHDDSILIGFWLVQICSPLAVSGRLDEMGEVIDSFWRSHPYLPPFTRLFTDSCSVMYLSAMGQFDEAHALLDDMEERGDMEVTLQGSSVAALQRFMLLREQGRLGSVAPVMQQVARLDPERSRLWRPGLLALYSELGMVDDARRELKASFARGLHFRNQHREEYTSILALLAEAAVLCEAHDLAGEIHTRLAAFAGQHVCTGHGTYFGPVSRYLGLLARLRGDRGSAEALLRQAVDESARASTPVYEARSRTDLAELLEELGRDEAGHQARIAAEIADELGMASVLERALAVAARRPG